MDWDGLLDMMTDTVRDTFGTPVLFTRQETGETFDGVDAVFDPDFLLQEAGAKLGVGTRIPTVDVKDSDIGGEPMTGDVFVIKGVRYEVAGIIPSSSGMTKAQLRRRKPNGAST